MDDAPQPQYSIDYLEQISTAPEKPAANNKLFFGAIIAAVLLAVVVAALLLLSGGQQNATNDMARLSLRLKTLQGIADSSQRTIKSSSLRSINTNLSLLLTNANRDIAGPLQASGVNMEKLNPAIVASESGSDMKKRLENGRLNAVFDRTYAREMSYQLETVEALIEELQTSTSSKSTATFLATTLEQVQPIQKQFADFTAATS